MLFVIIVLRVAHIFCAVFWVGFGMFNVLYLQPSIKAIGPDGQKLMQYLSQKTNFQNMIYAAATLTILSGTGLYYIVSGFNHNFMLSGYGAVLSIASVAGIIAWGIAMFMIRRVFNQMGIIGGKITVAGGPPAPELVSQMQVLAGKLGRYGKMALSFGSVALLGMSIARFIV